MLRGESISHRRPAPKPVLPTKTEVNRKTIYGRLVKPPSGYDIDYKTRVRNMERTRVERLGMVDNDGYKNFYAHNKEMTEVADRKHLYNRIKGMVECEMRASEHLFQENCPKPETNIEKEPEQPNISKKYLEKKPVELNEIKEEEERKLVEEKRLQLFIENSEELRSAAMAKRKKEIDAINYKLIQEKEKAYKEQKVKRRELANFEISKLVKMQTLEKNKEIQKLMEKKQQLRMELNEQVQEKEEIRKQEKQLKHIEYNDLKILNAKLIEEEKFEKIERIKKQTQRRNEIIEFNESRTKLLSQINDTTIQFDTTMEIKTRPNVKDDTAEEIHAKAQFKLEYEMFMKHHAIIKEERKRQNAKMLKMVAKQRSEIEELKRSIERENDEKRRKRVEDGNKALKEQLQSREMLLKRQKDMNRKMYEQSVKEYEEYLEDERKLWEKKKQCKWQIKKDLMDQIQCRKNLIEKQRKIDLENHHNCMIEFAEQEKVLKKLLNEL